MYFIVTNWRLGVNYPSLILMSRGINVEDASPLSLFKRGFFP